MSGDGTSSDQVIVKLIEMGFEKSAVVEAVEAVGPLFDEAIGYILNGSNRNCKGVSTASSSSHCFRNNGNGKTQVKRGRQSSILDHFQSKQKRSKSDVVSDGLVSGSGSVVLPAVVCKGKGACLDARCNGRNEVHFLPVLCKQEVEIGSDWEVKVNSLLQKHFGFSSLKNFQKEALAAWLDHQDCLVLAATGSGKSLCFQVPALLTGKVVVVISPLISLMHDQCSKLSKHGVSACFLGSGQPDSSVEQKAMRGMYNIIYVCPETVLRLIKPLQKLAENRGIALFAIDEVHCVSKWGHDFRPDYRRLSVLRENFDANSLKFLKFDIPLMALTATATIQVQKDILKSLCMSNETKIVLTSLFRSNLRFSVKHSRTSSPASYQKDFCQLIDFYVRKGKASEKKKTVIFPDLDDQSDSSSTCSTSGADRTSPIYDLEDGDIDANNDKITSTREKEMSVEYLENDVDIFQSVDDWDVACGEFYGHSPSEDWDICGSSRITVPPDKLEERVQIMQEPLEQGPTIIYVPTRKETLRITEYLCRFGVKAAAYNAALPKSHLRRVHNEFHENKLEVVVATIAFGMGIDKLNVRRIIHYGWPQSLEAYYQEAGRAGRDGKLAECTLYANLLRAPTLLPSRRSEDQTKQAYKMLSDCFRYGMNISSCRAKILVEYFGEDFAHDKCLMCDVCVNGPPVIQNLKEEAKILMQVIAAYSVWKNSLDASYDDVDIKQQKFMEKPNLRMFVSKIREESKKFLATDLLWWRGLARILEHKGYIREGDEKIHVQIKFPEPTELGLEFLQSDMEQAFCVYPEADMLLSESRCKSYSSFSEWGKGWADPEIRRQRLEGRQSHKKSHKSRKPRKRKSRKSNLESGTVRGRLTAKLLKKKS
ncbi:ATP-dependent DNA helicase Q-like SIM [Mangifera indica]|uniref:ATP-dependent DNA helicase Q-like SIM n=1 Tax=Mangifera indica TaxID=29780 RepID=UPI001CFBEA35|nr:ATP-dependent DNA helicase Q-like SIM [Mangifera indica]